MTGTSRAVEVSAPGMLRVVERPVHLGVQFARQMGYRTVAIGSGPEKERLAKGPGSAWC
jgi:hypothetical protein